MRKGSMTNTIILFRQRVLLWGDFWKIMVVAPDTMSHKTCTLVRGPVQGGASSRRGLRTPHQKKDSVAQPSGHSRVHGARLLESSRLINRTWITYIGSKVKKSCDRCDRSLAANALASKKRRSIFLTVLQRAWK